MNEHNTAEILSDDVENERITGRLVRDKAGNWFIRTFTGDMRRLGLGTEIIIGYLFGREMYATLSPHWQPDRPPHWVLGQTWPSVRAGVIVSVWPHNIQD